MSEQICQSCAMPMAVAEDFGTNIDGSKNEEYCQYCFKAGSFTFPDITFEQFRDKMIGMADMMEITKEEATEMADRVLPTLTRWKKA